MSVGSAVRRMFGPFEHEIAEAYRAIYVDLDACVEQIGAWAPGATRILEVGCGEGAMTGRLLARYPTAEITAIDLTPRLGRLFRGEAGRVSFRRLPVEEVAAERPGSFDLVVLCDVLHHVPVPARRALLRAVRTALAPGGAFVLKEWARSGAPIHWMCAASDRVVTGDEVDYMSPAEARAMLGEAFGASSLAGETTIGPWRNNLAILVTPPTAGG